MQVHAKLLDHRKRVRHFSFMGKEGAESWREYALEDVYMYFISIQVYTCSNNQEFKVVFAYLLKTQMSPVKYVLKG